MNGKQHLAAIQAGEVTGTIIRGIRKAINADNRRRSGWSVGRTAPSLQGKALENVRRAILDRAPVVVGEMHAGGLKVLRNKKYAKRLAPVSDIVNNLVRFRLVDFWEDRGITTPIYRAEAANGCSFDFHNIAWQSGGDGPKVLLIDRPLHLPARDL